MKLTPKQVQAWHILNGPARRVMFDGGARSGKTDVTLAWMLAQMQLHPGGRQLVARHCLDHALATVWRQSLQKIVAKDSRFVWFDSTHELRLPRHGSTLIIAGLDSQDRVDKILGGEYLNIFLNEATQTTWATVQTVITRLAQQLPGDPAHKLLLDCNPKHQRHWLYLSGVRHLNPETGEPLPDADAWARLHWTPYDNPYLPADYIATLEAMTGVQRRRMLDGEWCENAGAVYDEFDEDINVVDELPPAWREWDRVRGVDFGYTNPFVCLWGAVDPDGRLWVYRERYKAQCLVADHAKAIAAAEPDRPGLLWTVADHDAEDRATLEAGGIRTVAAKKDVGPGIEAVKARLRPAGDGRPRLMIHRDCVNTIAEMYDYVWQPATEARNAKEEPRKDRDHAMDVVRYLCAELDHGTLAAFASPRDLPRRSREEPVPTARQLRDKSPWEVF